jgi:hypothetical protein
MEALGQLMIRVGSESLLRIQRRILITLSINGFLLKTQSVTQMK